MIDYNLLVTGLARTIMWAVGFVVVWVKNYSWSVPHLRTCALLAFGIATVTNFGYMLINAGIVHSQTLLQILSAGTILEASFFVASAILASGPLYTSRKSPH